MTGDQIRQRVRDMLVSSFLDDGDGAVELDDDAPLDSFVDSVQMLDVILFIEEHFGFEVENDDAIPDNLNSVNRLVAYVSRKLAATAD